VISDKALVLENQVLTLSKPEPRALKAFKKVFKERLSSPAVPILGGRDQELFRDEEDLVALAPVDTDRLNAFLRKYFGWFFKVQDTPMEYSNNRRQDC